jgi:hypothetical protein
MSGPTHVVVAVEAGIIASVEPFSSEEEARERKAQLLRTADPMEDDVGMFEIMPKEVAV